MSETHIRLGNIQQHLDREINYSITKVYWRAGELDESNKAALEKYPRLITLDISHSDISDIEYLPRFSCIQILWICNSHVSDLHPLSYMKTLIELHLYDNEASDIGPLRVLTRMRKLDQKALMKLNRKPSIR